MTGLDGWLDPVTYGLGGDGVYCELCADSKDPFTAYLACDTSQEVGKGIYANVYNGTGFVRSQYSPILISATGKAAARYAPSMAPALSGGAFICYSVNNWITIRFIGSDGSLGGFGGGIKMKKELLAGEGIE